MATESAETNPKLSEDPRAARLSILTAARRVLARDGAPGMNFANVAKEAGVSAEAVASYFQGPQEVLLAIAADDLAVLARTMNGEAPREPTASAQPSVQPAQVSPRDSIKKKSVMTGPLEQVLKEVAPNPDGGQGTIARLERRIHVIEKAFADIVERHEKSLRERSGAVTSVEESVTALHSRIADLEKQQDAKLNELRNALSEAGLRLNVLEQKKPDAAQPAPIQTALMMGSLDVSPAQQPEPLLLLPEVPPFGELPPVQKLDDDTTAKADEEKHAEHPLNETYLSAARRAAMATVETDDEMSANLDKKRGRRGSRTKFLLFGCIAPVVIFATAFVVLNRHAVTAQPAEAAPQFAAAIAAPVIAVPAVVAVEAPPPSPPPDVVVSQPTDPAPAQLGSSQPVDTLARLAQGGDAKAARDVGLKYLAGDGVKSDESEAAQWLMRAAYKGEPTAEYWLATLYARGHGVPSDAFQANHWYEAAAKQGNRRAMHSLAVANFQGWGVEKNLNEAARWFEKSASLGLVDSQFNLAVLYERGAGVPQSLTDAYKWYAIAAAQGDKEADSRVAVLATQLKPDELAQAQAAIASFKPQPMDETANAATAPAKIPGG